jgi:hypothetical protein
MAKKKKTAGKKAAKKAASRLSEQSGGAEEPREQPGAGAGATDEPRSLPDPRVRVEDLEVLRSAIEGLSALLNRRLDDQQRTLEQLQQAAAVSAPAQPSPDEPSEMERLLRNTSDIRERDARLEQNQKAILDNQEETLRRVTVLEENQRPPAPAPDREAAARKAMGRQMLANQCRALNLIRPTPAIVGRAMSDGKAFDQGAAKSPQQLFLGILDAVRRVFRLATSQPGQEGEAAEQDYVHLTEEIVEVIEERSSIPKKKQSVFLNDELKPRLELLANSGLAREITIHTGRRVNYSRYLTPIGREVFDGWPEWDDRTGGVSLADEPMPPDPDAAGRPVTGAPATLETQPGSPPQPAQPQPSPPPPTSQAPAT